MLSLFAVAHVKDEKNKWWRIDDTGVELLADGPAKSSQDHKASSTKSDKPGKGKARLSQILMPESHSSTSQGLNSI